MTAEAGKTNVLRESRSRVAELLVGKTAKANHPITVLNPEPTFTIHEAKIEDGRIFVRGENTCWWGESVWSLVSERTGIALDADSILENAAIEVEGTFGRAHTLASENADRYIAQDEAIKKAARRIRAMKGRYIVTERESNT